MDMVCDHELGFDSEGERWCMHDIDEFVAIGDISLAVEFVRSAQVYSFCPYCGQRIDWHTIKAQLEIE